MGRVLVVQQVHTRWTKEARGGRNAVLRNAVPESRSLPVERMKNAKPRVLHHQLTYGYEQFTQPTGDLLRGTSVWGSFTFGCVTVHGDEEGVSATFRYDRGCAGVPDRGWARKTLFLTGDTWGQIVYNGRFVPDWDGDWWYEKMVVNIGLFERLSSGLFTRTEPTYRFSAMSELF